MIFGWNILGPYEGNPLSYFTSYQQLFYIKYEPIRRYFVKLRQEGDDEKRRRFSIYQYCHFGCQNLDDQRCWQTDGMMQRLTYRRTDNSYLEFKGRGRGGGLATTHPSKHMWIKNIIIFHKKGGAGNNNNSFYYNPSKEEKNGCEHLWSCKY